MSTFVISKTDKNLLIDYHTNKNIESFNELFRRLKPLAYKWAYKIVKIKYHNLPLEIEDCESLIYLSFKKIIDAFANNEFTAEIFLVNYVNEIKYNILKYCTKFITKKQSILNNYLPIETTSIVERNELDEQEEQERIMFFINELYIFFKSDFHKKILLLKVQGYTELEISKILNCKKKKISNAFLKMKTLVKNSRLSKIYFSIL